MDILGLILKTIGNEKLKQVSSVFAEGRNITRQTGGGIGENSLLNKIPDLKNIISGQGLNGLLPNNMLSSVMPALGSLQQLSGITNVLNLKPNTFSSLASALVPALEKMNTFKRTTDLLSGSAVPDLANGEYGLSNALEKSSTGAASLNDLLHPLNMQQQLVQINAQLQTLIGLVQSKNISDNAAVIQLNNILQPITDSMSVSSSAINQSDQTDATAAAISEILQYLDGSNSVESNYLMSILPSNIANQIVTENQNQMAETAANTAQAQTQLQLKLHREHVLDQLVEFHEKKPDVSLP